MNLPHTPELTDGVIFLRPLTAEDAVEHLAGEDEEMAKWLSGGRSTLANVEKAILNWQQNWQTGGPRRAFGVFDCASNRLVGFVGNPEVTDPPTGTQSCQLAKHRHNTQNAHFRRMKSAKLCKRLIAETT